MMLIFDRLHGISVRPAVDLLLNGLRNFLKRRPLLSKLLRVPRAVFHFGPWRIIPCTLIRLLRPPQPVDLQQVDTLLSGIDVAQTAANIERDSFSIAGRLPDDILSRLQAVTKNLRPDHYQLAHEVNEDVSRITSDPAVMNVLRAYLRSEPVLLESTFMITGKKGGNRSTQTYFHFDFAGWDSLNVMVYLSDVTEHTSPHILAKGTHREAGFRTLYRAVDAFHGKMDDETGEKRFGDVCQVITGPAGTVFFENTEAYHRRDSSEERRVMLNLLFASHRSFMSHGRTSGRHKRFRMDSLVEGVNAINGVRVTLISIF